MFKLARILRAWITKHGVLYALIISALIWLNNSAYAQFSSDFTDGLNNADTDLSMKLLRTMFGAVGRAVDGATFKAGVNPLIAELFRVLNNGVLVMVGFLITYTVIVSTINLAQDGQQALTGKVSPFVLLRIVAGCALLVPSFEGYSGVQVLVMTVIVQGIGFANVVWDQAIKVIDTGTSEAAVSRGNTSDAVFTELDMDIINIEAAENVGNFSSSESSVSGNNLSKATYVGKVTSQNRDQGARLKAADIATMWLCTHLDKATDEAADEKFLGAKNIYKGFDYDCKVQIKGSINKYCDNDNSYAYMCCGKWDPTTYGVTANSTKCGKIVFGNDNDSTKKAQAALVAFREAKGATSNLTANIRNYYTEKSNYRDISSVGENMFGSAANSCGKTLTAPDNGIDDFNSIKFSNCNYASIIYDIAKAYRTGLLTYFNADLGSVSGASNLGSDVNTMKQGGWATAGQFYSQITQHAVSVSPVTDNRSINTIGTRVGKVLITPYKEYDNTMINNEGYINLKNGTLSNAEGNGSVVGANDLMEDLGNPQLGISRNDADYYSHKALSLALQDYYRAKKASTPATSSGVTMRNTALDAAACQAAKRIYGAKSSLAGDMPPYLKSSNVLMPWNVFSAFGGTIKYAGHGSETYMGIGKANKRDPAIATDHALHNTMITMFMSMEALTGMQLFGNEISSQDDYADKAKEINFLNRHCNKRVDSCSTKVGSSKSFLQDLSNNGCLKGISNNEVSNIGKVGLFGMVFLDQIGAKTYPDPLRSIANMGLTMMSAAVYYYVVTMDQVFKTLMNLTAINVGVTGAVKLALALLNVATLGAAEAFFVGTGALVDALAQMMLSLDKYALELFLPLGSAVAGILFAQGVMLGVYIPFLPFFLYTFGVLGWLIAVTEAMVAAPLMALGLTHPEGNDLLGQAEQGLMLLLGVFLRPVATVLGLFLSISLSQTAMRLVNAGFMYVIFDYFQNISGIDGSAGASDKVIVICSLGLFIVYTYIAYAILEMSFALIYQIPDRILKWIGGQETQSDAGQMAKGIGQQTKGMAEQGASAAGSAVKRPDAGAGGAGGVNVGGAKDAQKDNDGDSANKGSAG